MSDPEPVFPLLSRRRGVGMSGLVRTSNHRGSGQEIASSRPYQRGDSIRLIDWKASARVSSARETDEFIVREHFAEEVPRIVLVVDRRPEMSLYPAELPWLHKPAAIATAGAMIVQSALAAQGFPGYLDIADPDEPRWVPPQRVQNAERIRAELLPSPVFSAPQDNVAKALDHLVALRRHLPVGSFVFVLSDFLVPPPVETWLKGTALGWDLVPVVLQDPRWEQSFPNASGVALPIVRPGDGSFELMRLRRREAMELRAHNERRYTDLVAGFAAAELDPVLLSSSDAHETLLAFLDWHDRRSLRLGRR